MSVGKLCVCACTHVYGGGAMNQGVKDCLPDTLTSTLVAGDRQRQGIRHEYASPSHRFH